MDFGSKNTEISKEMIMAISHTHAHALSHTHT